MLTPSEAETDLPAKLAEYGALAARLPGADPEQAERLHRRLRELDTIIDRLVSDLGITARL